jgi:hypothetical protein
MPGRARDGLPSFEEAPCALGVKLPLGGQLRARAHDADRQDLRPVSARPAETGNAGHRPERDRDLLHQMRSELGSGDRAQKSGRG